MAYKCYVAGVPTTNQTFFDAVVAGFTYFGFTLHDNISTTRKVYKSDGENHDRIPCYIEITLSAATVVFNCFCYWNASTHVGTVPGTNASYNILNYTANYPITFYGDRDFTVIYSTASTTTYYLRFQAFAHIQRYDNNTVVLASNATSGTNKILTVSGSLGNFLVGREYVIRGMDYEGRDAVYVSAITTASGGGGTLTVSNLPRNYNAGAIIGHTPTTFMQYTATNWRPESTYSLVGTATFNENTVTQPLQPIADADPDVSTNRYILQPWFLRESTDRTPIGYLTSSGVAYPPIAGATVAYDKLSLFTIGNYESGSSTNASTSTSLNDTSKAWTTNQHAGKIFVFTNAASGYGEGQTRIISSNTSNTLSWTTPLHTIPVSGNEYRIYDGEVWRCIYDIACKEMIP